jgi:hypothetical protein
MRIAAVAQQIPVERVVGLLPAFALEFDPSAVLGEQGTERRLALQICTRFESGALPQYGQAKPSYWLNQAQSGGIGRPSSLQKR